MKMCSGFLWHGLQMFEWKHIYISWASHLPLKAWKMCACRQRVGAPHPHPLLVQSAVCLR